MLSKRQQASDLERLLRNCAREQYKLANTFPRCVASLAKYERSYSLTNIKPELGAVMRNVALHNAIGKSPATCDFAV